MARVLRPFRLVCILSLVALAIASLIVSSSARPVPQNPPPNPPVGILYVDASATGLGTGSTWTDAYTSLDSAISAATSGDFILVADGTYVPTATNGDGFTISKSLNIYGGFAGGEASIDTRARLFDATILLGSTSTTTGRVFTIGGTGSTAINVVIDGFQIKDGRAASLTAGTLGGGIYAFGSTLTVGNCWFNHDKALSGSGGGIYITGAFGTPSTLNVKYCRFEGNEVEAKGGAIYGTSITAGDIVNSLFDTNFTHFGDGGAVYLDDMTSTAPERFTNCIFWSNYSLGATAKGGAIEVGTGSTSGGSAKIVNCTFARNDLSNCGNGTAVNNDLGSACEVHNTIVWLVPAHCQNGIPVVGVLPGSMTYSCVQYGPQNPLYNLINTDPLFRNVNSPLSLHLLGPGQAGAANPLGSPCLDYADKSKLPDDHLDVNGDGLTTNQTMPVNYLGSIRDNDWPPPAGNFGVPQGTYVDMGAFEKQ